MANNNATTPGGLYRTYRNLDIPLVNGMRMSGIDVREYRNNVLGGDFSTASGVAAFEELKAVVVRKCKKVGAFQYKFIHADEDQVNGWHRTVYRADMITTWPDMMRPYIGKGSPDDIRMAIRLAIHFGLLANTISAVQKYCDDNIGLDCSGFALAYYATKWTSIADVRDKAQKITRLEDIRTGDALIWNSGAHVALIDTINSVDREKGIAYCVNCNVAESTADRMLTDGPSDGLNYTEYALLFDGNDRIKAMRSYVSNKADTYDCPSICVRRPN